MTLSILLVIGSLALFILEVFIVSFGALTVVAVGLGVGGVVAAFDVSKTFGWTMVGVLFVGIPVCLRLAFLVLPKLPFARGFYLDAPELTDTERRAGASIDPALVGREGTATSALRPSGSALIDGQPLSVVSTGEMIQNGARVRVVEITGNRIVVEEI